MADSHRRAALVLAAVVVLCVGCGHARKTPPPAPVLVPPQELAPDLRMENSLLFTVRGQELLARSVVEKRGDRLDLWMLTPTGVRMCHIVQQGAEVSVDARSEMCAMLEPAYVLQDLRWAFFLPCEGEAECTVEHVEYETVDGVSRPHRVEIVNPTFGYEIVILVDVYEEL